MAKIVKGTDVVQAKRAALEEEIAQLQIQPNLTTIRVGNHPDQIYYEQVCHRVLGKMGFDVKSIVMSEDVTQNEFNQTFTQVNDDPNVHGILLLKPLPQHLSDEFASQTIHEEKDVDGFGVKNMLKVYQGDNSGFIPCTAQACLDIVDYLGLDLKGMRAVVLGYSLVVGKPLALGLMDRGATVKVCRSTTKDLAKECADQELIISAIGQAELLNEKYVNADAILIDVGINEKADGQIVGDFQFDSVVEKVQAVTPVPGGVGTVTNFVLAQHVYRAYLKLTKPK